MLAAVTRPVLPLQGFAQFVKHGGQLPAAKDVGMVQSRGPTVQAVQIVCWIEDLLMPAIAARVRGDHLAAQHHLDALDVGFDRHGLEGRRAGHAVAIGLVADHLVLIDLGRLEETGIERLCREGQRLVPLPGKALADVLRLPRLNPLSIPHTTAPQMSIQLRQVPHLGHRRGPVALEVPHPPLDVRLLLRLTHPAEKRLKRIVAGQGLVTRVQLSLSADQHLRRHRLGVVPPHFAGHAPKEGEPFNHAMQDRLGTLAGQGDGKRTVRVRPGEQQHRHLPAAFWEGDVDMAEVGLQALAGIVVQGNERLALLALLAGDVPPHAVVTAGVVVLGLQPAKDLGGGVLLLGRSVLIGLQDGIDDGFERIDHRGQWATLIRFGLGLAEDLPDLAAGVMKASRQFADAQLVHAIGAANTCILVHLDHPPPPCSGTPLRCTSLQEAVEGGTVFDKDSWLRVGPFSTRISIL
jgi:hypothetical protein